MEADFQRKTWKYFKSVLFHCGKKAIPNIQTFPFGEIQTAPHFAQKALNDDVMF